MARGAGLGPLLAAARSLKLNLFECLQMNTGGQF